MLDLLVRSCLHLDVNPSTSSICLYVKSLCFSIITVALFKIYENSCIVKSICNDYEDV